MTIQKTARKTPMSGMLSAVAGMLIAFFALVLTACSSCAELCGSVRGTITDPSGAAVVGATVTLRDVGTKRYSTGGDDRTGCVFLSSRQRWCLRVTVKAAGFKEFLATMSVEVHVSTSTK